MSMTAITFLSHFLIIFTHLAFTNASTPYPLPLTNGALNATDFTNRGWTSSSCSIPNAYKDYFIDVSTHSQLTSNLFIAVIVTPLRHSNGGLSEHLPNAIELKLWEDEIPSDRRSDLKKVTSANNVYSLVVNVNEIRAGRYYFSVKCGDVGSQLFPLHYDLLAEFEAANLTEDVTEDKKLCEGEMMLHYATLTQSKLYTDATLKTRNNVNFKVCTPPNSDAQLTILTKVGTPPLRIEPPMKIIDVNSGCTVFKVCGKQLDVGKTWVGVYARRACTFYNVSYSLTSDDDLEDKEPCFPEYGDELAKGESKEINVSHSIMSRCEPNEWLDFKLILNNSTRNNNLVVEVKTVSGKFNPDAISLHLFIGDIPLDRETEYRASTSSSSVFSIFKSSVAMNKLLLEHIDAVNIGIRCGATEQNFKIIAEDVQAKLSDEHVTRGEVCPGSWIYHFFDVPLLLPGESESDESFDQIEIDFKYYVYGTGEIISTIQMTDFPIRIGPPYIKANGSVNSGIEELRICNVERGKRYYAGVVTNTECMVYDVEVNLRRNNTCVQPLQAGFTNEVKIEPITINMPLPDSCEEGEYKLYSFFVESGSEDNLVIQLERRRSESDDSDNPDALELILFKDGLPKDYESEHRSIKGIAGTWSLSVDAHDIKPGEMILAVKCKASHVRYWATVLAIKAPLVLGSRNHGEICENEFVYHTFRFGSSILPVAINATLPIHLNVHVWRYSGEFSIMGRHGFYPLKLDPPSYQLNRLTTEADVKLCNVGTKELQVIALVGGYGCASYDAMSSIFQGECEELETFAPIDQTSGSKEIEVDKGVLGSCENQRHVDYFLNINAEVANKNLVFTVENLAGSKSFDESLSLCIFKNFVPMNRRSERCIKKSLNGVLSYPLNYAEVTTSGLWFFSVSCLTQAKTPFRFVAHSLEADLAVGKSNHVEVCPSNSLLQKHLVTAQEMAQVVAEAEIHSNARNDGVISLSPAGLSVVKSGVHLRLNIAKYVGDMYSVTRQNEPPLRLTAPYMYYGGNDHHMSLNLCDVDLGTVGYFAFLGGTVCSVFDATLYYYAGECEEMSNHDSSSSLASASQLYIGSPQLSSCQVNEWKDFYVKVTEGIIGSNLLFEVVLNEEMKSDREALSFHMYTSSIPVDRETPYVSLLANSNGVYSLAVSSARSGRGVVGMNIMMSVKCRARPVQFSLLGVQSTAVLSIGKAHRGEVCNDEWVYFYYDIPDIAEIGFVRLNIEKFVGEIYIKGQSNDMPLRLVYPFVYMNSDLGFVSIDACDAKAGERVWLAVKGVKICTNFDITANYLVTDPSGVDSRGEPLLCDSERHATRAVSSNFVPLRLNEYHFDHCLAGSFSKFNFKLHLDATDLGSNLAIVVEQLLEDRVDPKAITVYGFPGGFIPAIDIEGNAASKSEEAINNIHSVTLNFVDLMSNGGLTDIAFTIKCNVADTKFKILTELVKTKLTSKVQNGGVCPDAWIYHNYITSNQTTTYAAEGGETSKFLRFRFRLIAGSVYQVAVRKDNPPGFNSVNIVTKQIENAVAVMTFVEFNLDVCDVKEGENYFFGVFGSEKGCALYDIVAQEYEEGEGSDGNVKTCQSAEFYYHN